MYADLCSLKKPPIGSLQPKFKINFSLEEGNHSKEFKMLNGLKLSFMFLKKKI